MQNRRMKQYASSIEAVGEQVRLERKRKNEVLVVNTTIFQLKYCRFFCGVKVPIGTPTKFEMPELIKINFQESPK